MITQNKVPLVIAPTVAHQPGICAVTGCNQPAKWEDAIHGRPIALGRKWCTEHAICHRTCGTVVPYYPPPENWTAVLSPDQIPKDAVFVVEDYKPDQK